MVWFKKTDNYTLKKYSEMFPKISGRKINTVFLNNCLNVKMYHFLRFLTIINDSENGWVIRKRVLGIFNRDMLYFNTLKIIFLFLTVIG